MPYVFYDELPEGLQEADVVERAELESLNEELEQAREQRDQAIERAQAAEKGWEESKQKYANTFLRSKPPEPNPPKPLDLRPQTINELFKID